MCFLLVLQNEGITFLPLGGGRQQVSVCVLAGDESVGKNRAVVFLGGHCCRFGKKVSHSSHDECHVVGSVYVPRVALA